MKASEIRELKDNEIQERIEAEKASLFKMKLSHTISPLDDTNKIGQARKTIARLMTEQRKRQLNNQK